MSLRNALAILSICVPVVAQGTGNFADHVVQLVREVDAARLERTVRDLVSFGTRHVRSATDDPKRGTGAARKYLEARLRELVSQSGGRLTVARKAYPVQARRLGAEIEVVNIVATLRGTTDPERIYVVGGHYDSRNSRGSDAENDAPGANDDGSGTAAVVEACRILSQHSFPATIVFCCYDGEEQGLLGSNAHANELSEAKAQIDGMITNDIVGNSLGMDGQRRTGYVRAFSYAPRGNDSMGRSFARAAAYSARHVDDFDVRLVFRGDRYGRGGDHKPFFAAGYPAIRLTEPAEDLTRQHQNVTERDGKPYGDLPDYMDFDYLGSVCRLNVAVLAELASAPRPVSYVRAGPGQRPYIDVSFRPLDGVDSYEVVWRLTTAPDWQHAKLFARSDLQPARSRRGRGASGMMSARLTGVCLDDVVVGVRSVSASGARSRVQTPSDPDAMAMRGVEERRRR